MTSLKFIDLFAGLGGFHVGLKEAGAKCVFASEIDADLKELYRLNFGLQPGGDITKMPAENIPHHDLLCAGFPCQSFSKAGEQMGLKCPKSGGLFNHVLRVLKHHKPEMFILENVANLERHDEGRTWARMKRALQRLNYDVQHKVLSPHSYGIPQVRERLFVVGKIGSLERFSWPHPDTSYQPSIRQVLDRRPHEAKPITDQVEKCLNVWNEFLRTFPSGTELPSFPIWSMEFGADYPYQGTTPHKAGLRQLAKCRGAEGVFLGDFPPTERIAALPSYARSKKSRFPKWKERFITQNRELYRVHKEWIDPWLQKVHAFPPSLQKLEWHCKGEARTVWDNVIQFRASGVRIKRPSTAPSLVSMTTTQVPIIAWERRYMTSRECSRLQSLGDLEFLPQTQGAAVRALGNAVNAKLVRLVAQQLLASTRRPRSDQRNVEIRALSTVH